MAKKGAGRPFKYTDAKQVIDLGMAYFKSCEEKQDPITVTGLCIALDTTRDTLMEYEVHNKRVSPEITDAVKKLKFICEHYAEKMLYQGKNAAGPIFALKNFNWTDKQEIEHSGKMTLSQMLTKKAENPDAPDEDDEDEEPETPVAPPASANEPPQPESAPAPDPGPSPHRDEGAGPGDVPAQPGPAAVQ